MQEIEETLNLLVPETDLITKVVRYALFSGGKRLRPQLTLMTTEMLGGEIKKGLRVAAAIEMIHTYSLIHDDLPCMDDDDERRGKPTVHKAFSESLAVLAGDFLLTKAFEVIAADPLLNDAEKVSCILTLSKASGGNNGMLLGQVLDMESEGKKVTAEELQAIHEAKTGALIATSIELGAIISGGPRESLRTFGEQIGLAFQIADDILDAATEKPEKASYISLHGMESSKKQAITLLETANAYLLTLPYNTKPLSLLAEKLVHRTV